MIIVLGGILKGTTGYGRKKICLQYRYNEILSILLLKLLYLFLKNALYYLVSHLEFIISLWMKAFVSSLNI